MQTAASETEIKSRYLSICVHHYTLRAPCPKGQGTISKIVLIEYPTIILILTLSVPARSDFGYMTSSNTQSRVHVRGCGLYPNAT